MHIYPKDHIDLVIKAYVVIDDQSISTLGTPELFDKLGIEGEEIPYVLSSCNGKIQTSGRRAHTFIIESFDSSVALDLPVVTECDVIPDNRNEIPTPDITRHYHHLHNLESMIPSLDDDAKIVLLVGRDLLKDQLDQRIGSDSAPYAQKLPLGWAIVGESCLRRCHTSIKAFKTNILLCGRPSFLESCPNDIAIKQKMVPFAGSQRTTSSNIGQDVFAKTPDDEKISFSRDDRDFLAIMEDGFVRGENGNRIAPLQFRKDRPRLENNLTQALERGRILQRSLLKDTIKAQQFTDFMQKMLDNGHAEKAPNLRNDEEFLFIPIFAVYHPRKHVQARVVSIRLRNFAVLL